MRELGSLEISEFNEFLAERDPFLLDVREVYEWEATAIPGTVNIPLGEVPRRLHEIPRDRTILVICERGERSRRVGNYLLQQEFDDVVNLTGGTSAWLAREQSK